MRTTISLCRLEHSKNEEQELMKSIQSTFEGSIEELQETIGK